MRDNKNGRVRPIERLCMRMCACVCVSEKETRGQEREIH